MRSSQAVRLAMVAGEPSGDLLGASLLRGLRDYLPAGSACLGIGGPQMDAAGFRSLWPVDRLAVRGYVEALRQIPGIMRIRAALKRQLLADPPAAFIGIDAPDFNFGLEQTLRAAGIPIIHFISPSIWAWRGSRIKRISRAVDHMLCVFPFEADLYKKAGIAATYVGHPLADAIPLEPDPESARAALGFTGGGPLVGVLPGSRRAEIQLIAPTFFRAMALMQQREPALRFAVPAASPAVREQLRPLIEAYPQLDLTLAEGQSHRVIEASDALLIKSGTSTLEAALFKKPMVISYKVPWLTGQIMRRQGYLPYVGLPNVLAGRFVVPELLQHFATPQALADAVFQQLYDDANRRALTALFTDMHEQLRCCAAQQAARVIARVAGIAAPQTAWQKA